MRAGWFEAMEEDGACRRQPEVDVGNMRLSEDTRFFSYISVFSASVLRWTNLVYCTHSILDWSFHKGSFLNADVCVPVLDCCF